MTPRSPRSSAPEEGRRAAAIGRSPQRRPPATRGRAPADGGRTGRRNRRRTRWLGRTGDRLARSDDGCRNGGRSSRLDHHDSIRRRTGLDRVGRRHGARLELRAPAGWWEAVAGRRDTNAAGRRPHVREPRGDDVDDVRLEVPGRVVELLRVPGAAAIRDAPEARRLRHREPGEQPRVRLRGDGTRADEGRTRERGCALDGRPRTRSRS